MAAVSHSGFAGVGSSRSPAAEDANHVPPGRVREPQTTAGVRKEGSRGNQGSPALMDVPSESGEGGSEGESANLAGDSEPPLPGATGSDRRESDRAVGQAWDETGSETTTRVRSAGPRMTLDSAWGDRR